MPRKSRRSCEICGVREAHLKIPLFFANFPSEENRCKEWVRVTGNEDLVHLPIEKLHSIKHICGDHFKNTHFNKKKNKLKKCAVPCLNIKCAPLSDDQLAEFPLHMYKNQVSESKIAASTSIFEVHEADKENAANLQLMPKINETIDKKHQIIDAPHTTSATQKQSKGVERQNNKDTELTSQVKKLTEKLKQTKCTIKSLKKSAHLIDNIESPVLKELVLNTCRNQNRKPQGRRWTMKHKLSCLAILKRSPRTYKYLSSAVGLPSVKTLQNIFKKVPMAPGINESVLAHLKSIANNPKDRIVNLAFDEMAIKSRLIFNEGEDIVEGFEDLGSGKRSNELANHALVFMLQGLRKKFKQPIAFYFTKSTVSSANLA